ncbi:hypothetical protein SCFA_240007 [anaerobic digester metagenome]|uniref:Uncharacterized protein n=1 Tax=anaerobic digester metagenome TaxID=1263854 RepID=A0A485LYN8_9ZZZZ
MANAGEECIRGALHLKISLENGFLLFPFHHFALANCGDFRYRGGQHPLDEPIRAYRKRHRKT